MTKYITSHTDFTGAIVDIGPSVVCLSVLSSAAAVATQWRADRRRRVYDCPTAARSRQVSGHVVLLDAQSAGPSTDL